MPAFKKNQVVTCTTPTSGLTRGRSYTITSVGRDYVFVVDDNGIDGGYFPSRFSEKVAPTPVQALSPQNATIVRHLQRAGSITQREALMDHGVQSLTKRVSELVNDHHYDIRTNHKQHPVTGQRYARYELAAA